MTKNKKIKFAGVAKFGTTPAITRRIVECITTLEKGCEDSQEVFGFHTWNTTTPNIFCVLGNRWSLAQNVEHFNEYYLEREWYTDECRDAQKELGELLKDVQAITFEYVEYERKSTFKKCTLTVALRNGLFDGMSMTISPIKATAENRNSYGFEKDCFDSSIESLKRVDFSLWSHRYSKIWDGLTDEAKTDIGLKAGLSKEGTTDFFRTEGDFLLYWGKPLSEALENLAIPGSEDVDITNLLRSEVRKEEIYG